MSLEQSTQGERVAKKKISDKKDQPVRTQKCILIAKEANGLFKAGDDMI